MATAFLGYIHSPKWFNVKCNHNVNFNKTKKITNLKEKNSSFTRFTRFTPVSVIVRKRGYSTTGFNHKIVMSSGLITTINELGLNPVYCYENLNLETIKKQISNDLNGLSGVYMIINKITKDYYIGSASTNKFYSRFSNHLIYFTGSKIVKLAVKKYDLKNFAFLVLNLYPNVVTKENNRELLHLEDKYLKLLVPNYNILTEAGSSFGYKHTEIDRIKMKDVYSEIRKQTIGNLNKGKNLSFETREKLSKKALMRPPMSDEIRKKCVSNTKPVRLSNLDKTIYGEYPTILNASKAINSCEKTIRRALKTEKRLVKGL